MRNKIRRNFKIDQNFVKWLYQRKNLITFDLIDLSLIVTTCIIWDSK